jgi:hypothetical protein
VKRCLFEYHTTILYAVIGVHIGVIVKSRVCCSLAIFICELASGKEVMRFLHGRIGDYCLLCLIYIFVIYCGDGQYLRLLCELPRTGSKF